jgi:hypothetical protein
MWNPLGSLPQSNAGALAAYSPQVNQAITQPPMMTPPHMQGGQGRWAGLHPIFGGNGPNTQFPLNPNSPDGLNGHMGHGQPFNQALQDWRQDRPQFDPQQFAGIWPQFIAAHQAGGTAWTDFLGSQSQPFQDTVQQFQDWRAQRPARADF